ncbi:MAG: hypothetical protein JRI97_12865, partial [Deltaproteobacteria bacterium]|nr:hypothetical protein [Deltaproteobacteria bacterium]
QTQIADLQARIATLESNACECPLKIYPYGQLVALGPAGSFDDLAAWDATVVKKDGVYHMWYRGRSTVVNASVGYATSTDGVTWTKQNSGNPVLSHYHGGTPSENYDIHYPRAVVDENGNFRLYYARAYDELAGEPHEIWTAWSSDGITWNKHRKVRDNADLAIPLYADGTYYLWYTSGSFDGGVINFNTSPDGENYSWPAGVHLSADGAGSWEGAWVAPNAVTKTADGFKMWYMGASVAIGTATSTDGINWTKNPANPVLYNGPLGIEGSFTAFASVVPDDNSVKIYFSDGDMGATGPENQRIGMAIQALQCASVGG